MANEINTKRQLNFGFMNEEFEVPDDFDRMNEDEIAEIFYDEDIETLNKRWVELAKNQTNS